MVSQRKLVPKASEQTIRDLVIANRILAHEKVVDGYGHISVRHDKDPTKYLLAGAIAPKLVTTQDILTFDFDSKPIGETGGRYYLERFIHGEIYRKRPDVNSVIHCHAPELIPFGTVKTPLRPLYHMS